MNQRVIYPVLILCIVLVFTQPLFSVEKTGPFSIGDTIPDLEVYSAEGIPVSFRPPEGKHLWILFWNPNEEASEEWIKDKLLLYNRFHGSGLDAVGVCVGANENEAVSFSQTWRVLWPLVVENESDEKPADALGVKTFPYDVLIDSQGKIRALNLTGVESHEIVAKILGVSLDDLPLEDVPRDWKTEFYQVYRLKDDEILKRIASPFISERMEYCKTRDIPLGSYDYVQLFFQWDGALNHWRLTYRGEQTPLQFLLTFLFRLMQFEFEGPEDLLSIDIPGDWIFQKDASQAELFSALETILQKELGQNIRFVQRKVERQTIVASGKYQYHPPSFHDSNRGDVIHVYTDPSLLTNDRVRSRRMGAGGGSGAVSEFLQQLGNFLLLPVIDETESSDVETSWWFRQRYLESDPDTLKSFLKSITEQTSIQFRREIRLVPIWFVEKAEETIPALETTSVMGVPVTLRPPEGKILLIQFWNPMKRETSELAKELRALYKRLHESGLNAISICTSGAEEQVLSFASTWRILWPQVLDQEGEEKFTEKLGISEVPCNVLIDENGEILAKNLTGMEAHETIAKILNVSLDDLPLEKVDTDWKEKFNEVYHLEENEIVKRIPPPFIPERKEYYLFDRGDPNATYRADSTVYAFNWNGALKRRSSGHGWNRTPLKSALTFALQLSSNDFEGPAELLNINVPGDWITREESTPAERLQALESILQKELNQPIHFTQREVEREVIIVEGKLIIRDLEPEREPNARVRVFTDDPPYMEHTAGGGGGIDHLLAMLRDHLGLVVINKTEPSDVGFFYWRWKDVYYDDPPEELVREYMNDLAQQTSLTFRLTKLTQPVWFVERDESSASDLKNEN